MTTAHFDDREFTCKCGCGLFIPNTKLQGGCEFVRARIMRPLNILSGCRCPQHNKDCGGVEDSQHLYGTAVDVYADGISVDTIARAMEQAGFDGIGIYREQGFTHGDYRGYKARWEG